MKYKMLLSDIDGTLRPFSDPCVPRENVEAIRAIQSHGVKFAVSTGRSRMAIPDGLLNGIEPDYWICAAGSQVLRGDGTEIAVNRIPMDCFAPLVEFCTAEDYPLRFVFSDDIYAYVGYDRFAAWAKERSFNIHLKNGEDQTRHLSEMPFAATGIMPEAAIAEFGSRYPQIKLRFPYISGNHCDILWPGQSKAAGLENLLRQSGLTMAECVSVGDGGNDVEILSTTGMSYCVADGSPEAKAAAKRICPAAGKFGVAAICRELWPEAFDAVSQGGAQ